MNSLSWLLYTADVVGGLGSFLSLIAFVSGIGSCTSLLIFLPMAEHNASDQAFANNRKILKAMVITFLVTALINTTIPSKETVYAIAASEMGEKALSTPTASKAMKALNHWLDKQVEETEKK